MRYGRVREKECFILDYFSPLKNLTKCPPMCYNCVDLTLPFSFFPV